MNSVRSPRWYRTEAARILREAEKATDSPALRDSYLALALQYERLAVMLEAASRPSNSLPEPKSSSTG
jgi:hypothetical protein